MIFWIFTHNGNEPINLKTMKFNYKEFILSLNTELNPKAKRTYEDWIKFEGGYILEDERYFVEYLSKYKPIDYWAPSFLECKKDRDLLLRLICSSFSCDYFFDFDMHDNNSSIDNIPELFIAAQANNQSVCRKISGLNEDETQKMLYLLLSEAIGMYSAGMDVNDPFNMYSDLQKGYLDRYNLACFEITNRIKRFESLNK